jgi:hypothetical protein
LTFWGEATRNERLRAVSERQHQRWTRFLARILREGVATGEFVAPLDADMVAPQVAAVIDGLAVQATLGNPTISPARMRTLCLATLSNLIPSAQR